MAHEDLILLVARLREVSGERFPDDIPGKRLMKQAADVIEQRLLRAPSLHIEEAPVARDRRDDLLYRRAVLLAHIEAGDDLLAYLDAETDRWHDERLDERLALREHLGLTEAEFATFVTQPADLVATMFKEKRS